MPYFRRRNLKDIKADNSIIRWPEDRIAILLKNCSFDIEVILQHFQLILLSLFLYAYIYTYNFSIIMNMHLVFRMG